MPQGSKASLPRGVKNIMLFIPNLAEGKLCTIMDCAEYICHPDNPMYNKEKAKSHHLLPDFALNSNQGYARGRQLAQDNLDFLARTLRRQDY